MAKSVLFHVRVNTYRLYVIIITPANIIWTFLVTICMQGTMIITIYSIYKTFCTSKLSIQTDECENSNIQALYIYYCIWPSETFNIHVLRNIVFLHPYLFLTYFLFGECMKLFRFVQKAGFAQSLILDVHMYLAEQAQIQISLCNIFLTPCLPCKLSKSVLPNETFLSCNFFFSLPCIHYHHSYVFQVASQFFWFLSLLLAAPFNKCVLTLKPGGCWCERQRVIISNAFSSQLAAQPLSAHSWYRPVPVLFWQWRHEGYDAWGGI